MPIIQVNPRAQQMCITAPPCYAFDNQAPFLGGQRFKQDNTVFWLFEYEQQLHVEDLLYKSYGYKASDPAGFVSLRLTFTADMVEDNTDIERAGFRLWTAKIGPSDDSSEITFVDMKPGDDVRLVSGKLDYEIEGTTWKSIIRAGTVLELQDAPVGAAAILSAWLIEYATVSVIDDTPVSVAAKSARRMALIQRRDALLSEADNLSMEIDDLEHSIWKDECADIIAGSYKKQKQEHN